MENITLEAESSLTDRFQTTVPSAIRQALHLNKKDKIKYTIQSNGSVVISRVEEQESDPLLDQFLAFIANDIQMHPENIKPLTANMREEVQELVEGVDVDLDMPLLDEDE